MAMVGTPLAGLVWPRHVARLATARLNLRAAAITRIISLLRRHSPSATDVLLSGRAAMCWRSLGPVPAVFGWVNAAKRGCSGWKNPYATLPVLDTTHPVLDATQAVGDCPALEDYRKRLVLHGPATCPLQAWSTGP